MVVIGHFKFCLYCCWHSCVYELILCWRYFCGLCKDFEKNVGRLGADTGELARWAGISSSAVSSYENGTKLPKIDVAVNLADALGVSIAELVGEPTIRKGRFGTYADCIAAFLIMRNTDVETFKTHEQSESDPPLTDVEMNNYLPFTDPNTGEEETSPILWADFSVRNESIARFF